MKNFVPESFIAIATNKIEQKINSGLINN